MVTTQRSHAKDPPKQTEIDSKEFHLNQSTGSLLSMDIYKGIYIFSYIYTVEKYCQAKSE